MLCRTAPLGTLSVLELSLEVLDPALEEQYPANRSQGEALVGQAGDLFHQHYLKSGVATLTALGACRTHHLFGVESAEKGGLDTEHVGDLADGEERSMFVIEGVRGVLDSSGEAWAVARLRRSSDWGASVLGGLDRDLARLGALSHGESQCKDTVGVLGLDMVGVERLS